VDVSLIDADSDDLDPNGLARGVELIEEVVPSPKRVRLLVAGDFEQAVRDHVDDAAYGAAYKADRLFGRAAAKTIAHDDGTTDLIVDEWLLSKSSAPEGFDVQRMFHHEALHIAIEQRGEHVTGLFDRYAPNSNRGCFGMVTGVMVEEYRTERALCEAGRWPHEDYMANFAAVVHAFADAVSDALCAWSLGGPVDRCCQTVLSAFHHLATNTGYVAAEMLACGRRRIPKIDPAAKRRLLGRPWESVVDSLGSIPSAAAAIAPDELETRAWAAADRVEEWLRHVGFTLTDLPEGGVDFEVLRRDFEPPFK
jgi:hypothetical protein